MLLLYCDINGVVVARHDDSAAAVPLSAYPNAVRIIPYDVSWPPLERVGEPPPTEPGRGRPLSDPRPYQQPDATAEILTRYAAQVRFNTTNAGFSFAAASGTVPVATDRESYMLVGNTVLHAQSLGEDDQIDFTQSSNHYALTVAELRDLFSQFSTLIQQCRTIEAACIADLASASPTLQTYDDVDARFTGVAQKKKA